MARTTTANAAGGALGESFSRGMQRGRAGGRVLAAAARGVLGDGASDGRDRRDRKASGSGRKSGGSGSGPAARPKRGAQMSKAPTKARTASTKESTADDRSQRGAPVKSSHIIAEHIDVGVPRDTAYAQWTNYDDFAKFTKKESADQQRDDRVAFTSKIGPSRRKWETQIVEQEPGRRIAWRSIGGPHTIGVVTFHELDTNLPRLMVEMEYDPSGFLETVGNFLRMQRRRVRKDLKLFKAFIELHGEPTGKGDDNRIGDRGGLQTEVDEKTDARSR